jgi:ATP-dependent Clp protease ATP-binding subunit ClpC
MSAFTLAARDALGEARDEAVRMDRSWIGTEHLLVGLFQVEEARAAHVLRALALDLARLRGRLEVEGPESPVGREEGRLPTTRVRAVIRQARQEARRGQIERMGTDHLLLGILVDAESQTAALLEEAGITELAVRRELVGLPPEA